MLYFKISFGFLTDDDDITIFMHKITVGTPEHISSSSARVRNLRSSGK